MKPKIPCVGCGAPLLDQSGSRLFCSNCSHERYAQRAKAMAPVYRQVYRAIRRGDLPPPSECQCVDCHGPASVYEHRDYAKPLDVQPVCRRCNSHRGSAANLPLDVLDKRWIARNERLKSRAA